MARLDTFLHLAADQRASDLHFHAGKPPMVRYNGDLLPLPFRVLSEEEAHRIVDEFLTPEQREELERDREVDFAYVLEGVGRFRANVFVQSAGVGAVFRVIPPRIPALEDLLLPPALGALVQHNRGLVLVTGPTGSGKTTTLAAMIHELNRSFDYHIITIEDPIEYVHESVRSVVTQREVGSHARSFAAALRSALRESPDVLVVGEMRDYETVSLALSAAEAGVLVFATLHTNSAAKAIDRLLGACPTEAQEQLRASLSVLLRGVIAQRLCRLASGEGRIAAVEVLLHSHSVAHLIRENKIHLVEANVRSAEQSPYGTRCLERALLDLVREGFIDHDEARMLANDADVFERQAASARGGGE